MKGKIKRVILSLLGLAIFLLLILKLNIDITIIYSIKNFGYIGLAIYLLIIGIVPLSLRMRYLLLVVGERKKSLKDLAVIEYVSKYIYYITPFKLYIPAKALMLNKVCKVEKKNAVSVVTFEYALDMTTVIFFSFLGIYIFFRGLYSAGSFQIKYILLVIIILFLIFFKIPYGFFDSVEEKMVRFIPILLTGYVAVLFRALRAIRGGWLTLLSNRRTYYNVLPLMAIMTILAILIQECLFLSLNYYVPLLWIAAVLYSSLFTGGVSNIPGGLGVREGTTVALYMLLGVPKEIAIIVAILGRLLTLIPLILGYLFSLTIKWHEFSLGKI